MLKVEKIENFDNFLAIRNEWNDVLGRSEANNFYLTHEWLSVWWKNLGCNKKLLVICVKENNEITALAPLMISRGTLMKFPVKKVEFIGSGWGHGGFLLNKKKKESLDAIWNFLFEKVQFDIIVLSQIRKDLKDTSLLADSLPRSRFPVLSDTYAIPIIKLHGSWEEYLKNFRKGFRKTFENRERFLRKKGNVEFLRLQEPLDIKGAMEDVFRVSLKSWKAREGTAIASTLPVKNLYSDLAYELMKLKKLDISLLKLNSQPIAYIFGARHNNNFIDIDIAFDLAFSNVSPGIQLHNFIIKNLLNEEVNEFDFVMAHDYKKEYTDYERQFTTFTILNRGLYPKFLFLIRSGMFPILKKLSNRFSKASQKSGT